MTTTNPKSKRQPLTANPKNSRRQGKDTQIAKHDGAHSKLANVIAMLSTSDGADIEQIMRTTGWQRHTVRGVISGAIKKKLGLSVDSELRRRLFFDAASVDC